MNKLYLLFLLTALTLSGCQAGVGTNITATQIYPVPIKQLLIYEADNNEIGWNGNLFAAGQLIQESITTGVQGADALCQAIYRN